MMEKSQKRPLLESQTQIPFAIKTAVMLLTTMALFGQDLAVIFNDALQNETTSYILAVPFLFTYLIYRKRKMLKAVIHLPGQAIKEKARHLPAAAGVLVSIVSILIYWHGSSSFTPLEYHIFALPVFVAGLFLLLFNRQTLRVLAIPIAFLAFLTPPPSEILYAVGSTLSVISSEASNAIVKAVGIPSMITDEYGNPTITITRPNGATIPFTLDIACSGIYSLIDFFIFATFTAYIIRDEHWKKLGLLLVGIPLIYLLNILRITVILLIGYHYGEQLALQIFHLLGGWIFIFFGTLVLLTISEKMFKTRIFADSTEKCLQCNPKPHENQDFCYSCGRILKPASGTLQRADAVKVAAIAFAIVSLLSIQAPVMALTQNPPTVVVHTLSQQASTSILPPVPGYNLTFVYRDREFEARTKQDMSLAYLYAPVSRFEEPVWVALEIASTRSSLHRWEACLITWHTSHGYQAKVNQIDLRDIALSENPPMIGRYFAFQYKRTNETQVVLYWYKSAIFAVNSTHQQKHIKISLIVYPRSLEDLPRIENQLVALAKAITTYWQPIQPWSQVAMFISQNGARLAAATSIFLAAVPVLYELETRRQRRANTDAYQKLSKQTKQIVGIVHQTEKATLPTLNAISTTYQSATGENIAKEILLQRLSEAEEIGMLESSIANKRDEPIQIWKTQVLFSK